MSNELKHGTFGSSKPNQQEQQPKEDPRQADLRALIELGCVKDSVKVGEMDFAMRSLTEKEKLDISHILTEEPTAEQLFDFNLNILARSIESVNGTPLENLHPDAEGDVLTKRIDILSSMQSPVLTSLIRFYDEITKRCDEQYGPEEVKN